MPLSKVAAAAAINFCALGKEKVIFRAVDMFPDTFISPLYFALSIAEFKSYKYKKCYAYFFFQCVNFFQNVLFNLTT